MSAQINLYDPRFLKQRDLLTLDNLALATVVLYAVLAAAGVWAWRHATGSQEAATLAEAQLKSAKDKVDAETRAAAARRPNPQLAAEVESTEALLHRRVEIAGLLESGAIGSAGGFTEYLRGFARQAPAGLWLTGFRIGSGGKDMEIRGSMLDPAALPDYIRRLGGEKAFQGRSFAALTMKRGEPPSAAAAAGQGAAGAPAQGAAAPAPTVGPRLIDFVLMPAPRDAKETGQ